MVTSPIEKPKKAACTVDSMSPDSIRQGASTSRTAIAIEHDPDGAGQQDADQVERSRRRPERLR